MKKLQFLAWPKLCTMVLLGAGALFVASCASDDLSGEDFHGTYGGSQLIKPDAASITVVNSADRTAQTISWKTVNGALSYIVNVTAGDVEGTYDEIIVKDQTVRGNSITVPRKSKKYYRFAITTAYNPAENNTASDPNDPAVKTWDTFSMEISLPVGTDLATYFKENNPVTLSEGLPLMVNLEAGGSYTMSDVVDFSAVNVSILSNTGNKATLTFGVNSDGTAAHIVTDSPITLESVDIKFNVPEGNNGKPLIVLNPVPTYAPAPKEYYLIDKIVFNDVTITDLKNSLIHDSNIKYCAVDFSIMNSVIKLATKEVKHESIIAFQGGGVKDFTVKNSTIYGDNAVAKYFLRYQNGARIDRYGFTEDDTWSFTYQNNTFYGLLKEDGQWGNYDGIVGKPAQGVVTINKNIWYNCDPQTMRRMLKQTKFAAFTGVYKMADNTFWRDGGAVDQEEYTNKSEITTEPMFVAPAEGDFTLNACEQKTKGCGDPRWIK